MVSFDLSFDNAVFFEQTGHVSLTPWAPRLICVDNDVAGGAYRLNMPNPAECVPGREFYLMNFSFTVAVSVRNEVGDVLGSCGGRRVVYLACLANGSNVLHWRLLTNRRIYYVGEST